jgi:hypothetical protein
MSRWTTHRGDEWWYSDFWCDASASSGVGEPAYLSIESIHPKAGSLTKERIHRFLWDTQEQFPDRKLRLASSLSVGVFVEQLAQELLLTRRTISNPYSQDVEILSVERP